MKRWNLNGGGWDSQEHMAIYVFCDMMEELFPTVSWGKLSIKQLDDFTIRWQDRAERERIKNKK